MSTTEMRKTGVDVVGDVPGAHTFVSSTRRKRIFSKHWSPTAKLDWRTRSSACGWLPNPLLWKTQGLR